MFGADTTLGPEEMLAQSGWRQDTAKPNRWRRSTALGPAELVARRSSANWDSWFLAGGSLGSGPADLLMGNQSLFGLGKWVAHPKRGMIWRLDMTKALAAQAGELWATGLAEVGQAPLATWLETINAAATGELPATRPGSLPAEELVGPLTKKGWSATAGDDGVRVSITFPGIFRSVTIKHCAERGVSLGTEVLDLTAYSAPSRKAALHLARCANNRFRLIRLSLVKGEEGERLLAEVSLGWAAIPGPWLDIALEVFHTAIAATVLELEALRDEALAQVYLNGQYGQKGV